MSSPLPLAIRCLVALLCLQAELAAQTSLSSESLQGATMGTTYQVKWVVDNSIEVPPQRSAVAARIAEVLERINQRMSTYLDDSELSRFNASTSTDWYEVSDETAWVIDQALHVSRATDGYFDITVQPLVALWQFGPDAPGDPRKWQLPSDAQIRETLARVGHQHLTVRLDPPALRKALPNLQADLSAIAKGYAVDQLGEELESFGIASYLVEVGGEIRTRGTNAQGQFWKIGIETPQRESRSLSVTVPLDNQSMASSGDYRNFYQIDGVYYSHTIDPKTGRPLQDPLAAVSVIADECLLADAWATALMAMGDDRARSWIRRQVSESPRVSFVVFTRDESGAIQRSAFGPLANVVPETVAAPSAGLPRMVVISILVFGLAMLAMAVGVLLSNRKIQGSCGGLAGLTDDKGRTLCEACTHPAPECQGLKEAMARAQAPDSADSNQPE